MTSWDFWWFFCFVAVCGIPTLFFVWNGNHPDRWKVTFTALLVVVLILTFLSMLGMTKGI